MDPSWCRPPEHEETANTSILHSASAFERYLLAVPDHVRHSVFRHLSPPNLYSLARTSTTVYHLVKLYERVAWCLPRYIHSWFINPVGFMRTLEATSAVISGSQAVNFMDRRPPNLNKDLDIFVHVGGCERLGAFLISQGYQYHSESSNSTDSYANLDSDAVCLLQNGWRMQLCRDKKRIVTVLNFFGAPRGYTRQVQLIVVAVDPIRFILTRFHSSECTYMLNISLLTLVIAAVMNIITSKQAISIFPKATYINRVSYVSCLSGSVAKITAWKDKYTYRGFKLRFVFQVYGD
jgi:hypothetical protein